MCLIPFVGAFGIYMRNRTNNGTVLLLLIMLIPAIVVLLTFRRGCSSHVHQLAMFFCALPLEYCTHLCQTADRVWAPGSRLILLMLVPYLFRVLSSSRVL